jgi:hypothetical protein
MMVCARDGKQSWQMGEQYLRHLDDRDIAGV